MPIRTPDQEMTPIHFNVGSGTNSQSQTPQGLHLNEMLFSSINDQPHETPTNHAFPRLAQAPHIVQQSFRFFLLIATTLLEANEPSSIHTTHPKGRNRAQAASFLISLPSQYILMGFTDDVSFSFHFLHSHTRAQPTRPVGNTHGTESLHAGCSRRRRYIFCTLGIVAKSEKLSQVETRTQQFDNFYSTVTLLAKFLG